MSHFTASDPKLDNSVNPNAMKDGCLSIRTGKMSFVQYGFKHDPGVGKQGEFHGDQVILLVLNDHRNVHYQIDGPNGSITAPPQQTKDHVCILWPKSRGVPPPELAPEALFEHTCSGNRGQGTSTWPRESFRTSEEEGDWDAALIYLDPTGKYLYEYQAGPKECADDYRFALASQEIVPWLWEKGKPSPELILPEGETVTRALQAESGGTQGEGGGALPYPPG